MDNNWFRSFLGLAARAGAVESGFDACKDAVLGGKVRLILVSDDLSQGQTEKIRKVCESGNVPCMQCSASLEPGNAIGRPGRKIIAITQDGFAAKMIDVLNSGVAK